MNTATTAVWGLLFHIRWTQNALIARFMGPTWGPSGADSWCLSRTGTVCASRTSSKCHQAFMLPLVSTVLCALRVCPIPGEDTSYCPCGNIKGSTDYCSFHNRHWRPNYTPWLSVGRLYHGREDEIIQVNHLAKIMYSYLFILPLKLKTFLQLESFQTSKTKYYFWRRAYLIINIPE